MALLPKILFWTEKDSGVGYYRGEAFARCLRRNGLAEAWSAPVNTDDRLRWLLTADCVVNVRAADQELYALVRQAKRIKTQCHISDFDDDPLRISPWNDAYSYWGTDEVIVRDSQGVPMLVHQKGRDDFDPDRNKRRMRRLMNIARHSARTVVTTDILAARLKDILGKKADVAVLPNLIDFNEWRSWPLAHDPAEIRIGWQGGSSHFGDIAYVLNCPSDPQTQVLDWLMAKYPQVKLVIYGVYFPWPLKNIPPDRLEVHGWTHIDAHPYKSASLNLDIALAPLHDDEFNRHKSPVKWCEYSALGVPSICSAIPPYKGVVRPGETGLLANNPTEWKEALSALIEDVALRQKIGAAAHEQVRAEFDMDALAPRVFETYIAPTAGMKSRLTITDMIESSHAEEKVA